MALGCGIVCQCTQCNPCGQPRHRSPSSMPQNIPNNHLMTAACSPAQQGAHTLCCPSPTASPGAPPVDVAAMNLLPARVTKLHCSIAAHISKVCCNLYLAKLCCSLLAASFSAPPAPAATSSHAPHAWCDRACHTNLQCTGNDPPPPFTPYSATPGSCRTAGPGHFFSRAAPARSQVLP